MTTVRVVFKRDTDENYKRFDRVLHKNEMVCVISEEQKEMLKGDNKYTSNDVYNIRAAYKLGDGVHKYSELPFEDGKIPVVINMYPDNDSKRPISHKS